MNWTRNQPTEPGFYAYRQVDLDKDSDRYDQTCFDLIFILNGEPVTKHVHDYCLTIKDGKYRQIWWYGPLPELDEALIVRKPNEVEA